MIIGRHKRWAFSYTRYTEIYDYEVEYSHGHLLVYCSSHDDCHEIESTYKKFYSRKQIDKYIKKNYDSCQQKLAEKYRRIRQDILWGLEAEALGRLLKEEEVNKDE